MISSVFPHTASKFAHLLHLLHFQIQFFIPAWGESVIQNLEAHQNHSLEQYHCIKYKWMSRRWGLQDTEWSSPAKHHYWINKRAQTIKNVKSWGHTKKWMVTSKVCGQRAGTVWMQTRHLRNLLANLFNILSHYQQNSKPYSPSWIDKWCLQQHILSLATGVSSAKHTSCK